MGGIFEVVATGLPPGLGGYASAEDRLTGRIGGAFWVHSASAGIFIFTGVVYTIVRFVLPRIF